MRQVPAFGIVGDGRVARHFQHYFNLLGISVRTWSRREPGLSPPETFESCGTVLLLIRDDAIVPFAEEWPALRAKRLVHFSGCLAAPGVETAHPLMTFGPELYDLDSYRVIPFVLDAGGTPFDRLLPGPAQSVLHDPGGRATVLPRVVRHGRQLLDPAVAEAVRRVRRAIRDPRVGGTPLRGARRRPI